MWLPRRIVRLLIREADRSFPLETGGIVMGYLTNHDLVITDVIGPGPNASHGRYQFNPDSEYQERRVAEIYVRSGRVSTYLGDWHTHPEGSFRLSGRDRRTLRSIARSTDARCEKPLMVILAGDIDQWDIAIWRLQSSTFVTRAFRKDIVAGKLHLHD